MQEERHEPYQPPHTEQEQARQAEQDQPMRTEQAEQQRAMRAEQQETMRTERPVQETPTRPLERQAEGRETFLTPEQREQFRSRWNATQIEFVSDPRKSVEDANRLVGETVQDLNQQLTDQCSKMEQEWRRDNASTEDLRVALGRYRLFFDRLLSI